MGLVAAGSPRFERIAAVACGCAMAAGAALVATNDPAAAGSRFPGCTFRALTGLWCPGCGLTRGTHHLLRGDVAGALSSNVFTPFALAAIVLAWWLWTSRAFGRDVAHPMNRWPRWAGPALLVVVLGYGVLRNVPVAGLRSLAP